MTTEADVTARQSRILQMVREGGYVTLEALAGATGVSTQSVRRDILALSKSGLLRRFHGGAGSLVESRRPAYAEKRIRAAGEKNRIAAVVAATLPEGATIFLDVGTTCEALARQIVQRDMGLRIVTASLAVASILCGRPGIELNILGGIVRTPDGAITGSPALSALSELRLDLAIIAFSGFDDDAAPMDFDIEKVSVKRRAIERSDRSVLVGDAGKFQRRAVHRIRPISAFATLFSDAQPQAAQMEVLRAEGVALAIA
ncbi:DeoR/GlpR transcriptional regulator [Cereibacter changlensis JA139]|uniref:DeoR/GlpR transcriptional regulator n=2 Tax=Cereibacter changlensis TaxID=402884 RepID=A0A2T4JPK6_9RHOB|nr:DeoR/GlpR family DNA-binding transcription regulator [Cereibacter changlensis]PTE19848.1 DeoR/GlpR transcriptional regulator [Cereibacter changlensis JA139]PZX49985.1 DeoR family transcriptional regulator [Cereibacter changlensis]